VLGPEGCDTLRAELAVLVAGGTLVSVDPAVTDDALCRALTSFGVVQAIASDEKQLARILTLRPELPALELLLLMKAAPSERKPAALPAGTAIQVGAAALAKEPKMLLEALGGDERSRALAVVQPDGKARTSDRPVLLLLAQRIASTVGVAAGTTVLTALPRGSDVRLAAALAVTGAGATLLLADPSEAPDSGLCDHPIDAILMSFEALERLHRAWQAEIDGRSWIGRAIARWSLRQRAGAGRESWKHRLAESFTLRGLRGRLGGRLVRLEVVRGDSAPADSAVDEFFEAIGLPVHYLEEGGRANSGPVIAAS
jgi:hypothetical protein